MAKAGGAVLAYCPGIHAPRGYAPQCPVDRHTSCGSRAWCRVNPEGQQSDGESREGRHDLEQPVREAQHNSVSNKGGQGASGSLQPADEGGHEGSQSADDGGPRSHQVMDELQAAAGNANRIGEPIGVCQDERGKGEEA